MNSYLALMPIDENRIDGDKADLGPHAQGGQHAGFAEPDDRHIHCATHLQETRLLEVADDERVISCTLGFERIADGLRRASEFSSADENAGRAGRGREPRT